MFFGFHVISREILAFPHCEFRRIHFGNFMSNGKKQFFIFDLRGSLLVMISLMSACFSAHMNYMRVRGKLAYYSNRSF